MPATFDESSTSRYFRAFEQISTMNATKMPCALSIKFDPTLQIMAEYSKRSRMKILRILEQALLKFTDGLRDKMDEPVNSDAI